MQRFAGILPPLVTPLTEDGELDEPGLRRCLEHIIAGGVHGVVLLGSSGEAALLPPPLRRRVLAVALEAVHGRVPVIVGTGEPGTALAAESTRQARQDGADAAIVVPPYYFPLDQEAVARHFRSVREASDLPLLAYHIPAMTKVRIETDTLRALAEDGTLVGVKDSAGDFGYFQRVVDETRHVPAFVALEGSDQLLYAGMAYGGDGAISVLSQVAPAMVVALYAAGRAEDWPRAKALHHRAQEIREVIGPGWIPAIKGALHAFGLCGPAVAAPNRSWSAEQLAAQRQRLEAARERGLFDPATVGVAPAGPSRA